MLRRIVVAMLDAQTTTQVMVFRWEDQLRFAQISGDFNPIHVDALEARRCQAGERVVHGMHAALRVLDDAARRLPDTFEIATVKTQFRKFMLMDVPLAYRFTKIQGDSARIEVLTNESQKACAVELRSCAAARITYPLSTADVAVAPEPVELDAATIGDANGRIFLASAVDTAALFPALARRIGPSAVQALTKLSTIVGMYCPGRYSIFDSFDVSLAPEGADLPLTFRVKNFDQRFGMAEIEVSGSGVEGIVRAFLRQGPVKQMRFSEVSRLVRPSEFSDTWALVIGASRGLGSATAKILAAGGASVIGTYHSGETDALAVKEETGRTDYFVRRFDARGDVSSQLVDLPGRPTQLYYFATARIGANESGKYMPALFQELCALHVDGFAALLEAITKEQSVDAFYPSTIFLDTPSRGMLEYCMAKSAAETLCADINRTRRARVIARRLPRARTDQTVSIVPEDMADPVKIMLPIVREMHQPA